MFKVQDNKIIWGDSEYLIPAEFNQNKVINISGTATHGLNIATGIFLRANGESGSVALSSENVSGRVIGDIPERGSIVYLREQLDPVSHISFWLISKVKIDNNINWINVEFDDGRKMVLCPFTMQYGVIDA